MSVHCPYPPLACLTKARATLTDLDKAEPALTVDDHDVLQRAVAVLGVAIARRPYP